MFARKQIIFCTRNLMSFIVRLQKKFKILLFEQRCWFVPKKISLRFNKCLVPDFSLSISLWNARFHHQHYRRCLCPATTALKAFVDTTDSRHTFFSHDSSAISTCAWLWLMPPPPRPPPRSPPCPSPPNPIPPPPMFKLKLWAFALALLPPPPDWTKFQSISIFSHAICRIITERSAAARSGICVCVAWRYAYACNPHKLFNIKTDATKMCLIGKQFSARKFTRKLNLWPAADDCTRNRQNY